MTLSFSIHHIESTTRIVLTVDGTPVDVTSDLKSLVDDEIESVTNRLKQELAWQTIKHLWAKERSELIDKHHLLDHHWGLDLLHVVNMHIMNTALSAT